MQYFRIKEWDRYQHYKDRSPPWIKLHRETLTSQTWVMLPDEKKALAVACMLLAAATDNKIPLDPEYVKRVAYMKSDPDFQALIEVDFIEIIVEKPVIASRRKQPLADASKPYSEESREEKSRAQQTPIQFDPFTITGLDHEAWKLWLEHRAAIKKPIRPHAMQDAAEDLAKLGSMQMATVKKSRANGYQGLFPEKPLNGSKPHKDPYAHSE